MPVPPMKFSAEAKALLGDEASVMEGSSSSQKDGEVRGYLRLDKTTRRQSPAVVSERFRQRHGSPAPPRDGSPRIVRLNMNGTAPSSVKSPSSLLNRSSPEAASSQNFITPGPRTRLARSASSNLQSTAEAEDLQGVNQSSAGSQYHAEPTTHSKEHSSIQDAEAQMGNLSISRSRADETGAHTGQRQKRVQVTGKFLRGPARRGMKRGQSEEDQTPNREGGASSGENQPPENEQQQQSEPAIQNVSAIKSAEAKDVDPAEQQRPPHVRFQSQASIITGSPEQKRHEHANTAATDASPDKLKPTTSIISPVKTAQPVYRLPPPAIPSRFDQENEPPPTFKRNKILTSTNGEHGKIMVAQDDKMLIQTH